MNRKALITLFLIGIYVITSGISLMIFSQKGKAAKPVEKSSETGKKGGEQLTFDQTLPRTEVCPLNGAKYPKPQREWWEKHRPLGVMIENHEDARPQSGLSFADVIYESVAEGAITRFLAVFYCQDAGIVGPVRSARTYFIDFISEYAEFPLYVHVGGANRNGPADALGQIDDYGWRIYNDLNQFSLSYPDFYQDRTRLGHEVATEHTMYSKTGTLWRIGKERKLTNVDEEGTPWDKNFVEYSFKEDAATGTRGVSQKIHEEFWEGFTAYNVDWEYDPALNIYKRSNGGKPHLDRDTNKQLTAKNIVVLSMIQTHLNDPEKHMLYKTKGTGKATIFMDGKQIDGTWRKDKRESKTLLFDKTGKAIQFNRGLIWFQVLPANSGIIEVK